MTKFILKDIAIFIFNMHDRLIMDRSFENDAYCVYKK